MRSLKSSLMLQGNKLVRVELAKLLRGTVRPEHGYLVHAVSSSKSKVKTGAALGRQPVSPVHLTNLLLALRAHKNPGPDGSRVSMELAKVKVDPVPPSNATVPIQSRCRSLVRHEHV